MRKSSRTMARRSFDPPYPSTLPGHRASRARPDFAMEAGRMAGGARCVAGVDEVGRGPLAGPVVAAAVILDPAAIPDGIDDSKALSAARRVAVFEAIVRSSRVAVASVGAAEIDRLDIRQATLLAMRRALAALPDRPDHALIDGRDVPPGLPMAATAVVQGDARCLSIAAASVVAKVMRDRMMRNLARQFPVYGFDRHMGYPTPGHREALARHGPSPHHRRSFSPVRQMIARAPGEDADPPTGEG